MRRLQLRQRLPTRQRYVVALVSTRIVADSCATGGCLSDEDGTGGLVIGEGDTCPIGSAYSEAAGQCVNLLTDAYVVPRVFFGLLADDMI